jgi:regulation of enolase protein 1 (concanavalin A-like superfamily)
MRKRRKAVRAWGKRSRVELRAAIEPLEVRLAFSHNGDMAFYPMAANLAAIGAPGERISPSPFAASFTYTTDSNGLPLLNSFPSAPAAIYLDLDGDPGWGGVQPYNFEGSSATMSLAEQHAIVENWRELASYYSMFNVNVTTVKPANSFPFAWLVWGDNPTTDGGLSQVNVFPNPGTGSAQSLTGSGFQFRVADTHAHEVGHNFGAWHIGSYDAMGNATAEYATAHDPLHGPIMGNGPTGVIEKWILGHSVLGAEQDAARLQDDMREIAQDLDNFGGDGYRPDDYLGTIAGATQLLTSGATQAISGIIERLTDADSFKFTSTGGRYSILVGRDYPSGVDVKMSVYDGSSNLIATVDGDPRNVPYTMVNDASLTLDLAAGTYYIVVESHGNYGDQGQYVVRVDPMAANWKNQDVGLNRVPGYSSFNSATNTYTVAGSGADIWGTNDGFQYLYQTLSGDGEIIARVASMENTGPWAKAGVMIRETLADNAREAYVVITPSNGVQWSSRTSVGGTTTATTPNTGTAFTPTWLRLVRSGNNFTAFRSTTGTAGSWIQIGSPRAVTMGSTVYVGMVVSAVQNEVLNQATFTNLSITGNLNAGPVANSLPAPAGVSVGSATSTSLNVSWSGIAIAGDTNGDGAVNATDLDNIKTNFGGTGVGDTNGDGRVDILDYNAVKANFGKTFSGYSVERSADGVNFSQIGTTAKGVTSYLDSTGLGDALRYFYRVRALDGATVSAASNIASGVTRAGAVSELRVISYAATQLVVDWIDASGESTYRIERSPNGTSGWTSAGTVTKNVPLFVSTGLTAGTQYFYRVVTIDGGGDSGTSIVASGFTRLAAVTNLRFTTRASNQLVAEWNAVTGATGYKVERSINGTTWSTVAANQAGLVYTDNTVTPVEKYYYRITALNGLVTGTPQTIFTSTPAAAALPSGWTSSDINITTTGNTRIGTASVSGSTLTVVGGGADIWGGSDQFRFTYVSVSGNTTITARVVSIAHTDYFSRAGVMIRNSTSSTTRSAALMVHQSDAGVRYQYRTNSGGGTGETVFGGAAEAAPYWVRLTRTASSFLAEASSNGTTWSTVDTVTLNSINSTMLVGLALTPRDNNFMNKAVFDNVTIVTTSGTITLSGAAAASGSGSSSGGINSPASGSIGSAPRTNPASSPRSRAALPSILASTSVLGSSTKAGAALKSGRGEALPTKSSTTQRISRQAALVDLAIAQWQLDYRERTLSKAELQVDKPELFGWRK